jgi:hypothetical protein
MNNHDEMVRQAKETFYARHLDRRQDDAQRPEPAEPRARAQELLTELDARFVSRFPGQGSVFDLTPILRRRYVTPQATIDEFWRLVESNDLDQLRAWLAARPKDRATLLRIYEERQNGCA